MLAMFLLTQQTSWLSSMENQTADSWSTCLLSPHVLCCRANALKLVGPQPVLTHGVAPSQMQDTVFVSVELHEVLIVPSIQLVNKTEGPQGPSNWLYLNLNDCFFSAHFPEQRAAGLFPGSLLLPFLQTSTTFASLQTSGKQ